MTLEEHTLKTYVKGIKNEIKGTEEMIKHLPLKAQKEYHTGRKHAYLDALEELEPIIEKLQHLKQLEANADYTEGFKDAIDLVLGV